MPMLKVRSIEARLQEAEGQRVADTLARILEGDGEGAGRGVIEVDGWVERIGGAWRCRLFSEYADLTVAREGRGSTAEAAAEEAASALREVLRRRGPYLDRYEGRIPVMELDMVARPCGAAAAAPPRRYFVRKLTPEDAMAELDLSGEPGMVFYNTETGRPTVLLNDGNERFRLLEPSPGTAGRAGVETTLDPGLTAAGPAHVSAPERTVPSLPAGGSEAAARKYLRFRPFLRCPACRGALEDRDGGLACPACRRLFEVREGVPILSLDPGHDPEPRDAAVSKNPYGQQTLKVFEKHARGLVLDSGSGCPPRTFPNVVHLEIVRYPGVDVVADGLHLPFADETFDAAVSEAVLEHVKDPFGYVGELRRVLKPGGEVRVDAAFLQPYHAFPHHYFNMTLPGLELLMEGFEKIDAGCGPHQQPIVTLGLVLQGVLDGITDPAQRERALAMSAGEILRIIREEAEKEPFQTLRPDAVTRLAAGFYFYGYKPPR